MSQSINLSSEVTVEVGGSALAFDQPPIIQNGSTLVPLRAIFEKMGAEVSWDRATQTVTGKNGDTTIKLTLGSQTATKNGSEMALNQPLYR